MKWSSALIPIVMLCVAIGRVDAAGPGGRRLPAVAEGWSIELAAEAPAIVYPTAIVAASDGTIYVGSDPMDMTGPPTSPIDSVVAFREGRFRTFASGLWSVMGLEWVDGTLYVVHAPFLSALRDTDGDGRADSRVDLVTGLGPKVPGASGMNDHVASGIRLGMDGYLYIAVGDKGIPRAVGRDGATIQLKGGGVIRVRPDGTGLEVVSTGERNPLSVALSAGDEVFTYGNDDDSKRWPNSLTHHIVGGHYGYPYEFLASPSRALPIMGGRAIGAGAQGVCYNEDRLPESYRGNLFFCDWGLQEVHRFVIRKRGGTYAIVGRSAMVTKGPVVDFRPFSLAIAADGDGFWLVDWAYNGWLDARARSGRLYRLRYKGTDAPRPVARPTATDRAARLAALDHPALSVRVASQRLLASEGASAVPFLIDRLQTGGAEPGRIHSIWALDAVGGVEARKAIRQATADPSARVRLQAARSAGIHRDRKALTTLTGLLKDRDPAVRREAAIALSRIGDRSAAAPALYAALGDSDRFAVWSIQTAIRRLAAWDEPALAAALVDPRRSESTLELTDEAWTVPVVRVLGEVLRRTENPALRLRIVANLAGLYRQYPEWSGDWYGPNPLASEPPSKTRDWSPEGMQLVLRGLMTGLADRDAEIRERAIEGLSRAGAAAAPALRAAMIRETDLGNQESLANAAARVRDAGAVPILASWLIDKARPESVRLAALRGLAAVRDARSLRARLGLIYDPKAPPTLVAVALPGLAATGVLPPNELCGFLDSPSAPVRAAALLSLNLRQPLGPGVKQSVLDRLKDPAVEVRRAAILAAAAFRIPEAVPALVAITEGPDADLCRRATAALCRMPDPRAVSAYIEAVARPDTDSRLRRAAESALVAIRDRASGPITDAARSVDPASPAALSLERVLARFEPIRSWRVIGPFPRSSPQVFLGERSIDFARSQLGAGGRAIGWKKWRADPRTGRVDLDDLLDGAGGGNADANTAGLSAFAYAEIDSASDGPALLLLGSAGSLVVTVNEKMVENEDVLDARAYAPDEHLVRFHLARGRNRILVQIRHIAGPWSFGVQVALAPAIGGRIVGSSGTNVRFTPDALRRFAITHEGDARRGERIFFDARGGGCASCHRAGGHGTSTIGPDLTGVGRKYDRGELIRSVLEPSRRIADGYRSVTLATRDGRVLTGVVRAETEAEVTLVDGQARATRVPKHDVAMRRAGVQSIMPSHAAEALSPAEFADLIGYLSSLKQPPGPVQPSPSRMPRP